MRLPLPMRDFGWQPSTSALLFIADFDDEFSAAHPQRGSRRAETDGIRIRFCQPAGNHSQRTAFDRGVEHPVMRRGIEGEFVQLEGGIGASRELSAVTQRDTNRGL